MLFISFIGIVGVIYYLSSPTDICTTYECQRASEEFRSTMDLSEDPCNDFYQYTCGNWAENHPHPNDTTLHDWSNIIDTEILLKVKNFLQMNDSADEAKPVHQARAMFKNCVSTETNEAQAYKPLFVLLQELGLPFIPTFFRLSKTTSRSRRRFDWIKPIVKIKQALNLQVLINFEISPELTNGNVNRIVFELPKPGNETELKRRTKPRKHKLQIIESDEDGSDLQEEDEDDNKDRIEYITFVMTELLSAASSSFSLEEHESKIKEAAETITKIEEQLHEIIEMAKNETEGFEHLEDVRNYTISDLQDLLTELIPLHPTITVFEKYLNLMFDGMPEHVKFNQSAEEVMTGYSDILYFSTMIAYLKQVLTLQDLELYIWWNVVETATPYTTEEMRIFFSQYITELEMTSSRTDYCTNFVNSMMGMVTSQAIVKQEFLDVSKPKIEDTFQNVREVFKQIVAEVDWMDEHSKVETLGKLERMQTLIGFPEWLLNQTALAEYYKDLIVNKTSLLLNYVEVSRWKLKTTLLQWRATPKLKWDTSPTTVNAFYLPRNNAITLPLAFLQYPYYHLGLESLNYGSLGTFLGHELTHGFDNTGRILDKYGNYIVNWSTNQTREQYDERALCFVNQYGNYSIPEMKDTFIDGELTLDENIADNGGLREALMAYRLFKAKSEREPYLPGFEHFTDEQLFFISFGISRCETYTGTGAKEQLEDAHAPGRVRVNAVLSNSDDFKKTFNCQDGSGMFPVEHEQCRIW